MINTITHIGEAFGGRALDALCQSLHSANRATAALDITHWPMWFNPAIAAEKIRACYALQASSLGFSAAEVQTFAIIKMPSLCRVCQNNEGSNPNMNECTGGFVNSYYHETAVPIKNTIEYIKSLLDPQFTHISLYPHRMSSMDEFIANLYHEVTHHLIEIRWAQKALKRGENYQEFCNTLEGNTPVGELRTIIHEALAHLEAGQRTIVSDPVEASNQAGVGWTQNNPSITDPYRVGSNLGFEIYRAQIGIYNTLTRSSRPTGAGSVFEKWCTWVRDELLEALFESERLGLIGEILNQHESDPVGFLQFFEQQIAPLPASR